MNRTALLVAAALWIAPACGKDQPKSENAPRAATGGAPQGQDGHGAHAGHGDMKPEAKALPAAAADARRVEIAVTKKGYQPSTLEAGAGENLVLVFTRTEDFACGQYITVQGTEIKAELPVGQAVEVPVTMPEDGELVFACGMDMMHGIVTVSAGDKGDKAENKDG